MTILDLMDRVDSGVLNESDRWPLSIAVLKDGHWVQMSYGMEDAMVAAQVTMVAAESADRPGTFRSFWGIKN